MEKSDVSILPAFISVILPGLQVNIKRPLLIKNIASALLVPVNAFFCNLNVIIPNELCKNESHFGIRKAKSISYQ